MSPNQFKAELINEVINSLSDKEKIIYLTLYFDQYDVYSLKQLCGLKPTNYEKGY